MAGSIGAGRRRVLAAAFIAVLALAACGKQGPPEPPEGEKVTYPRTYPSR